MNLCVLLSYFCEQHGPRVVIATLCQTSNKPEQCDTSNDPKKYDQCERCAGPTRPYASSKDSQSFKYISHSLTTLRDSELIERLQHISVRSLSCEVNPSTDGFIIFGDNTHCFAMSYGFHLRDFFSRGQQRWFSISVLSNDSLILFNLAPFFSSHITSTISGLQSKAVEVFNKEIEAGAIRSKVGAKLDAAPRPFSAIVADNNIFRFLHSKFTWILANYLYCYQEHQHFGHPNEDRRFLDETLDAVGCPPFVETMSISLRDIYFHMGRQLFSLIATHVLIGNQLVIRSESQNLSHSIIMAFSKLLPIACARHKCLVKCAYEECYRSNLVAVKLNTSIPTKEILNSNCALVIDISGRSGGWKDTIISRYFVPPICSTNLKSLPTFLSHLEAAIQDSSFTDIQLEKFLTTLKDQWTSRSKTFFHITKLQSSGDCPPMSKVFKTLDCDGSNPNNQALIRFFMQGISQTYKKSQFDIYWRANSLSN